MASQTLSHFGQSLKKIQGEIITRNLFEDCHFNDSHEMSRLSCRKPDKTGNFWADILQYYSWYSSDYTVKHSENFQCFYYRKKYSSTPTICASLAELSAPIRNKAGSNRKRHHDHLWRDIQSSAIKKSLTAQQIVVAKNKSFLVIKFSFCVVLLSFLSFSICALCQITSEQAYYY